MVRPDLRAMNNTKYLELFVLDDKHPGYKPGRIERGVRATTGIDEGMMICFYDSGAVLRLKCPVPLLCDKYKMTYPTLEGGGVACEVMDMLKDIICLGSPLGDCMGPMMNTGSDVNAYVDFAFCVRDGTYIPRLFIVTSRAVAKDEELCIAYGASYEFMGV